VHWLVEQNKYLQNLISVSTKPDMPNLRPLLNRVIRHYEQYYEAKSRCAKQDVLDMLTPSWTSTLEDAFIYVDWRVAPHHDLSSLIPAVDTSTHTEDKRRRRRPAREKEHAEEEEREERGQREMSQSQSHFS
jgi:hypothetical protein